MRLSAHRFFPPCHLDDPLPASPGHAKCCVMNSRHLVIGHPHGRQAYARSLLNLASACAHFKHRQLQGKPSTLSESSMPTSSRGESCISPANPSRYHAQQRISHRCLAAASLPLATAQFSHWPFHCQRCIASVAAEDQAAPIPRLKVESDKQDHDCKSSHVRTHVYPQLKQKKPGNYQATVADRQPSSAKMDIVGEPASVKSSPSPKESLSAAPLDAVSHWKWRYQPYLLNGDPVEVETDHQHHLQHSVNNVSTSRDTKANSGAGNLPRPPMVWVGERQP